VNDSSEPVIDISDYRRQRFRNNINDMLHLIGDLFHKLADSTQQTPNRAANISSQFSTPLRNPFARKNQQRGDSNLLCNSVHFLNSSINQSLDASSVVRDLNNSMAHPNRVNISNNKSQHRRHPPGNHVNEQVNVNNQENDFSRIVGEMLTPLIQNGGDSQISIEASINSFGKGPLLSLMSI
jgi:hypothetical protein